MNFEGLKMFQSHGLVYPPFSSTLLYILMHLLWLRFCSSIYQNHQLIVTKCKKKPKDCTIVRLLIYGSRRRSELYIYIYLKKGEEEEEEEEEEIKNWN